MTLLTSHQQRSCDNLLWFSLFIFCLIGLPNSSTAQRTCGSIELHEQKMKNPIYKEAFLAKKNTIAEMSLQKRMICNEPVLLPMAVHYSGLGTLSDADKTCLIELAQNQIQILNDDYGGTNSDINNWSGAGGTSSNYPSVNNGETCIQFCLARLNHPDGYGLSSGNLAVTFNQVTGDNAPDWSGYINIFVKNINALGYSPLGGSGNGDGVAITLNAFGSGSGCPNAGVAPGAPYNLGRTLTHELGHYLLLDHIWGNGCNVDDGISDTPSADDSNFGCPGNDQASCGGLDLHMNYMDYTNDACMYMFTAGQSTVMENYTSNTLAAVIAKGEQVCRDNITFVEAISERAEGTSNCSGTFAHTITVELSISSPSVTPVRVDLAVAGASTATAGEDYDSVPTSVVFPAGTDTNQSIEITVFEDAYVENDETLIIEIVNVNNADYLIAGDGQYLHTIKNDDNLPNDNPVSILSEDFNNGLGNWTVTDGGSVGDSWEVITNFEGNSINNSDFIMVNSDAAGRGSTSYETLTSPAFDATQVNSLSLNFDHYFRAYNRGYREQAHVEVFDGTDWQSVYNANGLRSVGNWNTPVSETIDLTEHINEAMQIRFIYDAEWDYYWAIDNIELKGRGDAQIQRMKNDNLGYAEHELGPNTTIHFYDQTTGNIMVTIENLSNHDYGCTKVQIDNNGTTSYRAEDAAFGDVTDKNFRVIPEFNNPNGAYNITLYYTKEEIDGWVEDNRGQEPASALQMLKGEAAIQNTDILEAAEVNPIVFGKDWAYTARYNTGFSGFALGNDAVVLPISWQSVQAEAVDNAIHVHWATSTETDNKGFFVQRKTTTGFKSIAWVSANPEGRYIFIDKDVRSGETYFYQIQQEGIDGQNSTSVIVSAMLKENTFIKVYPNPFSNELRINNLSSADWTKVELFDNIGKRIYHGRVEHSLTLSHLEPGIYLLYLTDSNGVTASYKVMKQ